MKYSLSDITNTLEYKLGNAILSHKRITGGGGNSYYIDSNTLKLLFKLRKAKFTYRKQQKFYEKIILFFPQYEKEPVFIHDANELIKPFGITTSLKYKIGKIIKSRQRRWYKGGFYYALQEARKELALWNKARNLESTIQHVYTQAYHTARNKEISHNKNKNADNTPHIYNHTFSNTSNNTNKSAISHTYSHSIHNTNTTSYIPHTIIDLTYTTTQSLEFMEKNLESIKTWIESKEFQYQYIDTNHPYPPLLNPNTLEYASLSAESAWDLNIPLPSNYEFILVTAAFCGHSAMIRTLRKCNINIAPDHYTNYGYSSPYEANYEILYKSGYNVINLAYHRSLNSNCMLHKFVFLLPKKAPILYLVRDPIERLRSYFHVCWGNQKTYYAIDLQDYDKNLLHNRAGYDIDYTLPLNEKIHITLELALYHCHTLLTALRDKGFEDITCLDMKEILPKNIFSTLQNLSTQFGFNIPYAREEYEKTYYIGYGIGYLFPMKCQFMLHTQNISIYIVLSEYLNNTESYMFNYFPESFSDYHDITDFFNFTMPPFLYPIAIITHKQYLKDLQDNRESLQALNPTLQQLLNDMYQQIQIEESKKMSEKEILELLQTDIPSRQILKKAIDTEIAYIKDVRPDIVQSWRYYQKFKKICKDSMLL